MASFIAWYLLISLLGLLTLPLVFKLLPALPDRGYALARALGLLLWGFLFWLLGSLGFLLNDIGGQLVALILVSGLSWWASRSLDWQSVKVWMREHTSYIITTEVLFLVAFIGMAVIRAANPETASTEKPMELAFINAILRSPTLPPHDPWLSGYAISYYYFGYVLVSMLARLTGTLGSVAFNLSLALVFALSAVGSYGLLYNLLRKNQPSRNEQKSRKVSLAALMAPFFVLIVSNLGGFLHILRIKKVFWKLDEFGVWTSSFWSWLDIGSYRNPPPADSFPLWWWWQASRIVQDFDFNGVNKGDIIDEFPTFSFILGDLHPHVLAMPFAFLVLGLALNLFLGGSKGKILHLTLDFNPTAFLLSAVVLGGMAFLNIWDFPIYTAVFAAAYALRNFYFKSSWRAFIKDFFGLGIVLGITGILLYLPFYIGFSSQAGGMLPNLIYITRGVYLWIMFAPFLFPLLVFLFDLWHKNSTRKAFFVGAKQTLIGLLGLLAVSLLLAALIAFLPRLSQINPDAGLASSNFLASVAAPNWGALLGLSFLRRLTVPGTLLTLFALISLGITLLWHPHTDHHITEETEISTSDRFVVLLVVIGALTVLVPEFVFLRDLFGYRINTIFKFYFQAWHLWSVATAYAVFVLWGKSSRSWKRIFRPMVVFLIGLTIIYPVFGYRSKTNNFNPSEWTLDGAAYIARSSLGESQAMAWLRDAPLGVIAEAVGGNYNTNYARMAIHSGLPAVLGWAPHENQWRGGYEEIGSRQEDIEHLYCTSNWDQAQHILSQYNIMYIVVGDLERVTYVAGTQNCPNGLTEVKFSRNLDIGYANGSVTIYLVK
ncbi:MAG: DUF2298 domain-containing protein [Chloroflexota bacterium]